MPEEADCKAGWTECALVGPSQGGSQITPTLPTHSTQQPVFPTCHTQPHPSGCWRDAALIYPTWFCFLVYEGRKYLLSPANLPSTSLIPNLVYSTFYFKLIFLNCSQLPASGKGMLSPEAWRGGVSFPVRLLCKLSLPLIASWDCLLSSLPPVVSEQIRKRSMFYPDNSVNVEKNCW